MAIRITPRESDGGLSRVFGESQTSLGNNLLLTKPGRRHLREKAKLAAVACSCQPLLGPPAWLLRPSRGADGIAGPESHQRARPGAVHGLRMPIWGILGTALEWIAIMLLALPIFLPIIKPLGYESVCGFLF